MSECRCSYFDHGQICVCGKFRAPCGGGVKCYDVCQGYDYHEEVAVGKKPGVCGPECYDTCVCKDKE